MSNSVRFSGHYISGYEADMLSIALDVKHAQESKEILPGVVVDFDRDNRIIAFEISDAKKSAGLSRIKVAMSPLLVETHR